MKGEGKREHERPLQNNPATLRKKGGQGKTRIRRVFLSPGGGGKGGEKIETGKDRPVCDEPSVGKGELPASEKCMNRNPSHLRRCSGKEGHGPQKKAQRKATGRPRAQQSSNDKRFGGKGEKSFFKKNSKSRTPRLRRGGKAGKKGCSDITIARNQRELDSDDRRKKKKNQSSPQGEKSKKLTHHTKKNNTIKPGRGKGKKREREDCQVLGGKVKKLRGCINYW